jgi:hypothetical protein
MSFEKTAENVAQKLYKTFTVENCGQNFWATSVGM